MSGFGELKERYEQLTEISSILNAMKTLSLVETKKLTRFISSQRLMLSNIEAATADFSAFYPIACDDTHGTAIVIAVGSERGFCGNFNERIHEAYETRFGKSPQNVHLIIVGNRLRIKFEGYTGKIDFLEGATVAEDVPHVIDRLMDTLQGASALYVLAHEAEGESVLKRLLPFEPPKMPIASTPPLLQLLPGDFLVQMLDQYLLSVLYGLLYESLLSESRQRLAHMEQALKRLEQSLSELSLKRNALRQEKIIEEIEVILSGRLSLI